MGIVGSIAMQASIGTFVTRYYRLMQGWLDNDASGQQHGKLSWPVTNPPFPNYRGKAYCLESSNKALFVNAVPVLASIQ